MKPRKFFRHNILGDIVVMDKIGQGGYASIWKAYCTEMKTHVCIKVDERREIYTKNEYKMMKLLNHPLTCQLYSTFEEGDQRGAFIELIDGMTILDFVNKKGTIKELSCKFLIIELLSIMNHLHNELHMIHQDLKCENVIIDTDNNLHLIDFGFAHFYDDDIMEHAGCGTPGYIPPEVIKGGVYDYKSDMFSVGILLYAMLVGKLPFFGGSAEEIFYNTCNKEPDFPPHLSSSAVDLLRGLLAKNPKERPDVYRVMSHPWLNPYIRGHLYRATDAQLRALYVLPYQGGHLDPNVLALMKEYSYDVDSVVQDVTERRETNLEKQYIFLRRIQIKQKLKSIHYSFFIEVSNEQMPTNSASGCFNAPIVPIANNQQSSHSYQAGRVMPKIVQPRRKLTSMPLTKH